MLKTSTIFFFFFCWAAIMDLLINLKYWIFLFLIFFSLSRWFSFSFAPKIYSILKMFLLSVQNNYIEFICRRACPKKSSLNFMSLVVFKASKTWLFFSKNLLQSKFSNYFQAEIIPWSPMFLNFLTEFHMV